MTSTLALIGKSGSGKTTLTKCFLNVIRKNFPNATILLVDNDLSLELSDSFLIKTRNTIYGVKSGKHEYKTGIPNGMSKQEFIEWAIEDIIVEVDENTDLIASWLVTPKDCKCPSSKLTRDAVSKLIERYDFVIFDCEYDLKYLNLLVDYPFDEAVIVSKTGKKDIALAYKISEASKKYIQGQLCVILNKVKGNIETALESLNAFELDLLGTIEENENIEKGCYDSVIEIFENLYSRMNLPQINN